MNQDERKRLWEKRLAKQQDSGLNVSAWCRDAGINHKTFYRWHRKLSATGDISDVQGVSTRAESVKLVAVSMTAPMPKPASVAPTAVLELETPGGFVIRLSARAHLDWLAPLLAVL